MAVGAKYTELGLSVPVTEVLDPCRWRERYAHGIDLGASTPPTRAERVDAAKNGTELSRLVDEIPDRVIKWHLRVALSDLELKLGVPFGVEVVKSHPVDDGLTLGVDYDRFEVRKPYTRGETLNWFRIDLPAGVISIERIRGYYFGRQVWDISGDLVEDLVHLQWGRQGIAHIIPRNLEALIVTNNDFGAGNYGVWETINLQTSPVPDFWSVDYTRGPVSRHGGAEGTIEAALAHWVYAKAGVLLLSMGGLARSQGITSASVSMDGVSRSVSLQASAIYGLNSALEHALEQSTKGIDWNRLRSAKRGLRLKMFSY